MKVNSLNLFHFKIPEVILSFTFCNASLIQPQINLCFAPTKRTVPVFLSFYQPVMLDFYVLMLISFC